ncbi:MAG: ABC transporter substrate-binding protein [Desulfamplus sp.]|nr:ABC transporter substrate-binding protein [Desulfamplus sp.]
MANMFTRRRSDMANMFTRITELCAGMTKNLPGYNGRLIDMAKPRIRAVTCCIVAIVLYVILIGNLSRAISDELGPDTVLKKGIDGIISIINSPFFSEENQKNARADILFSKAEELFDFRAFSMGALGRNWRGFSESQKAQFTSHFARLISQTYLSKLDDRSFKNLDILYLKTEFLQSTKSGIERVDIFTEVHHNGVVTPVDYRMMKSPETNWKIYDVKIEGVSLVGNYREQYRTRFNDTPETLIQEIKDKVAK